MQSLGAWAGSCLFFTGVDGGCLAGVRPGDWGTCELWLLEEDAACLLQHKPCNQSVSERLPAPCRKA